MTDKLIISNTDNYNQDFEFSDTKTYVGRYIELINEYMLYVVENMIIQDIQFPYQLMEALLRLELTVMMVLMVVTQDMFVYIKILAVLGQK